jgi:hypothetical protein
MKIILKIYDNYFNVCCCVSYYHAQFELEIPLVCRETNRANFNENIPIPRCKNGHPRATA